MPEPAVEALVILDGADYLASAEYQEAADYQEALGALRRNAVVTQFLPPRLALVALPTDLQALHVPQVRGATVYEDDVPDAVLDKLSEKERLFVSAWATRRVGKERIGDHLPWDAPGYSPPDRPPAQATTGEDSAPSS